MPCDSDAAPPPRPPLICATCGVSLDDLPTYWTESGKVCPSCYDQAELTTRTLLGYRQMANTALGFALLSVVFDPCWLVSLTSIAGSVGVFRHPSRLDEEESLALVGRVQERTKATLGLLVVLTAGTLRALGTVLNLGLF